MCIAIVKPQGKDLTDEAILNGFTHNPDGAGYAYSHNDKLAIKKGFFDPYEFVESIRSVQQQFNNPPMLIHCRFASHGKVNETNCHPLKVTPNLAVIHNGILPKLSGRAAAEIDHYYSDTWFFVERFLKKDAQVDPNFFKDPDYIRYYEKRHLGTNNKICFLSAKGEFSIMNEKLGYWQDECWFSNMSCHMSDFNADPTLFKESALEY